MSVMESTSSVTSRENKQQQTNRAKVKLVILILNNRIERGTDHSLTCLLMERITSIRKTQSNTPLTPAICSELLIYANDFRWTHIILSTLN